MQIKLIPMVSHPLLAAGLMLGLAAAQAAGGFTVRASEESLVAVGMDMNQVERALGAPAENVKYGNEPGRTFTYRVVDEPETWFDVDFGSDGRVKSASQRFIEMN